MKRLIVAAVAVVTLGGLALLDGFDQKIDLTGEGLRVAAPADPQRLVLPSSATGETTMVGGIGPTDLARDGSITSGGSSKGITMYQASRPWGTTNPGLDIFNRLPEPQKRAAWVASAKQDGVPFLVIFTKQDGGVYPVRATSRAAANDIIAVHTWDSGEIVEVR